MPYKKLDRRLGRSSSSDCKCTPDYASANMCEWRLRKFQSQNHIFQNKLNRMLKDAKGFSMLSGCDDVYEMLERLASRANRLGGAPHLGALPVNNAALTLKCRHQIDHQRRSVVRWRLESIDFKSKTISKHQSIGEILLATSTKVW